MTSGKAGANQRDEAIRRRVTIRGPPQLVERNQLDFNPTCYQGELMKLINAVFGLLMIATLCISGRAYAGDSSCEGKDNCLPTLAHFLFGSLNAQATEQYSNVVGFQGTSTMSSPTLISTQTANTFQFAFGWQNKPILKDLDYVFQGYKEAPRDRGGIDDLILSALTVTATMGETRGYQINTGGTSPGLQQTATTRPSFTLSAQYTLPIESLVGHLWYPNTIRDDSKSYLFTSP
jgi:hypothetical protein